MVEFTRRQFIKIGGGGLIGLWVGSQFGGFTQVAEAAIPGGDLDLGALPKFQTPLLIPPVMPKAGTIKVKGGKNADYYEISVRQFQQQILPAGSPATTVWGYGALRSASKNGLLIHNAPSLTIEAQANRPTRVKWVNELRANPGNPLSAYLPHLLPVDPTLHWANPPGGATGRDTRPAFAATPGRYTGPVPIVTHVHGAVGVGDESDGYAEAWYLPEASGIPTDYATTGTWYDFFKSKAAASYGATWGPGFATFQYPNANRASTIWYHDHTLGMTRLNVYAGPAGFYIVRGGPAGDGAVLDSRFGTAAVLPGPAPKENDKFPPNKTYFEIPIAIQDRAFNADGSLFYPDSRAFFDSIAAPYIPETQTDPNDPMHSSSFSPIWNPEFFGNTIMVNGNTWPFQTVQKRRYRFRFLNGCQSRFLILDFANIPGVEVWQIGNEGGFLAAPVNLTALGNQLLMGLAERADVIVDFTNVPVGNYVLGNLGPDAPFGGLPIDPAEVADPATTGQIMQFRVVPAVAPDPTTPPQFLVLPPLTPLPAATVTRPLALIEKMGMGVDAGGNMVEGPLEALLGTVNAGLPTEEMWMAPVTENPAVGATEVWEFYNTTGDAHPMHVHEVVFEVVNREGIIIDPTTGAISLDGVITLPEPGETGFKDTVTAYPGQVTRIRAQFNTPGQFVWHCHIVEHEDNEMMRPFRIGPEQPGQPPSHVHPMP
jgi:FtsP/CotA-like multicopper oxidase with cupredoxin domain